MATTIQQIELPKKARAVDTSGNNNHGQIYSGRALEFDGVSDYLNTGEVFQSTFRDSFSISFWVKPDDGQPAAYISVLGARDATGDDSRVYFNIQTTGKISFYYEVEGTVINAETNLAVFNNGANSWHRVVGVVNNTTNQMHVYVNGVDQTLDGTNDGDIGSTDLSTYTSVRPLFIGGASNDGLLANIYAGLISDVQIWNTVLSADDVTYDYLNPESLALNASGTSLTESNLKLWYPMQDGHRGQQSYILDGANSGLGVELANFADGNITFNNSGASVASSNSLNSYNAVGDGSTSDARPRVSFALTTGQTYKIEYTPTLVLDGGVLDFFVGGSRLIANNDINTSFTKTFTSADGYEGFDFDGSQAFNVDFTLSIKAINDKHHATTVFYGDELVLEGDFSNSGAAWTTYGNITVAVNGGAFVSTGDADGGYGACVQAETLIAGRTYELNFDVTAVTGGGSVYNYCDSLTKDLGTASVTGFTDTFVSDGTGGIDVRTTCSNGQAVTIDNISLKEVGVASGWTDADQQLHIPQTALQSYNELAWFDGTIASDGYVDLDSAITTDGNNWSLSFWVFHDDNGQAFDIVFGDGANQFIALSKDSVDKLMYRDSSNTYHAISDAAIPESEWVHITITAIANTSITAYVNGVAQATNSTMTNTTLLLERFMRGYSSVFHHTFGTINEISYYNDVLTSAEVLDLFNDGKAKSALEADGSAGLVGYWRNNGLSEWKDLKGSNDGNTTAGVVETILIPQGVDSTRDNQGFIMNKQKDTSCLNLTNGSDNPYVDLGSETVVAADDAVSFSVWLKPDDVVQNYFLGHSSQNSIKIYDATTIFYRADNAPVNFTVQTIIPEQWVHVVLVKAGGGTDEMSVYVNGALNGTASTDSETSNEPLDYRYLGAERDWTNSFRGAVDGFLIYNKALDGTEILRNYNATKGNHRN